MAARWSRSRGRKRPAPQGEGESRNSNGDAARQESSDLPIAQEPESKGPVIAWSRDGDARRDGQMLWLRRADSRDDAGVRRRVRRIPR